MENFTLAAVIFDLDGLMVDTEPLAREAWNKVLVEYDRKLDDDLFEQMIGLRLADSARLVQKSLGLNLEPAELFQKEQIRFEEIMESGVKTMPGLGAVTAKIRQYNLPWAVATSSRLAYAKKVLETIELLDDCQVIVSGEEVSLGKPNPDIYLLASRRLKVEPDKCLALEDSIAGCQAARSAGMNTVAVPSPLINKADYRCAHYVLPSLADVALLIEKLMKSNDALL